MRELSLATAAQWEASAPSSTRATDGLDHQSAKVFALIVDWAEAQFRQLGKRDAHDLALTLFAGIQGAALLANTFRDPEILSRQARHLDRWIDSLT